jgi:hypothetical protein
MVLGIEDNETVKKEAYFGRQGLKMYLINYRRNSFHSMNVKFYNIIQ